MELVEQLKAQESARCQVYRGLAEAFGRPQADLPLQLKQLEAALARLESEAVFDAARLVQGFPAELEQRRRLEVDYTALFIGPFRAPAPPYGSVYLEDEHRLMGQSTIDVLDHYRSRGLDLSVDFKEAPDHVSAELEFMAVLIGQTLAAIDTADEARLTEVLEQQRVFLQAHLGAWMPLFAARVREHAQCAFYRHLADAAGKFLAEELAAAREVCP